MGFRVDISVLQRSWWGLWITASGTYCFARHQLSDVSHADDQKPLGAQLHLTMDDALFKQAKESYENRYKKNEERGYTNDHAGLCWPII